MEGVLAEFELLMKEKRELSESIRRNATKQKIVHEAAMQAFHPIDETAFEKFFKAEIESNTSTCYNYRTLGFCKHQYRCLIEVDESDEEDDQDIDEDFSEFNEDLWNEFTEFLKNTEKGKDFYKIAVCQYLNSLRVAEKIAPNQKSSTLTRKRRLKR